MPETLVEQMARAMDPMAWDLGAWVDAPDAVRNRCMRDAQALALRRAAAALPIALAAAVKVAEEHIRRRPENDRRRDIVVSIIAGIRKLGE